MTREGLKIGKRREDKGVELLVKLFFFFDLPKI